MCGREAYWKTSRGEFRGGNGALLYQYAREVELLRDSVRLLQRGSLVKKYHMYPLWLRLSASGPWWLYTA
jgi:hypothetical protein